MVFNHASIPILFRVILLTFTLLGFSMAMSHEGYYVLSFLLLVIAITQIFELNHRNNKTNREITRFLTALKNNDFSQTFKPSAKDKSSVELSECFNEILTASTNKQQQQQQMLHHLKSMTEHIPVPLLSLFPDGRITLRNNAARRLFSSAQVTKTEDLKQFGSELFEKMSAIKSAKQFQVDFRFEEISRQLSVTVSQITTGSVTEYLVSLQDIQTELDSAQITAWENLIRVLTHEIMNSLTPISSLAKTSADLVSDVHSKLDQSVEEDIVFEELDDANQAVTTVARRADGLMQFVQSYRSLTLMPTPNRERVYLDELFKHVSELMRSKWREQNNDIKLSYEHNNIEINADKKLLEQIFINLLTNAEHALQNTKQPEIRITASISKRGMALIAIEDNGPGIDNEIKEEVFVPFFTTKTTGSGVGLALTKQIMNAHDGSVLVGDSQLGGAKFTLIF